MKYISIILLSALTSCGAIDKQASLDNVKKTFPKGTIYSNESVRYVIIQDSIVYMVVTDNLWNANVSDIKILQKK